MWPNSLYNILSEVSWHIFCIFKIYKISISQITAIIILSGKLQSEEGKYLARALIFSNMQGNERQNINYVSINKSFK